VQSWALSPGEFATLRRWVASGSPGPTEEDLRKAGQVANPAAVTAWEAFFNADDPRRRLISRYIYEHVYLAAFALAESPGDLFRLVRSKTAAPAPIEIIDTPLPYTNPLRYAGVERFYYRLRKITTPIVQKNHFVWHLDKDDIEALEALFLTPAWPANGDLDPPWDVGNPFLVFAAIPAESRYRFLIRNSELIVSGITYGPVCLGQTATYAVKDHFWVYFLDPAQDVSVQDPKLGLETWNTFMDRSFFGNDAYEAAYAKALARLQPDGYSIDAVWDGGKTNRNAWLTVLRHESNTSVLKGRQGGIPRSLWLMSYSGFERIYYDTVAGFEYWEGDISKLETLGFFNFLRQEFEDNFLLLLPKSERTAIRDRWTRGLGAVGLDLLPFAGQDQPARVEEPGPHPLLRVVYDLQAHLGREISGPVDRLNPRIKPQRARGASIESFDDWVEAISTLTVTTAYDFPRYLPSVILLKLDHGDTSRLYSLIANRVYASQDLLFFQNGTAIPSEDTMSVYPTVIGGFPNLFMELDLTTAPRFIEELQQVSSLDDWNAFRDRYAVLRNSERMWPLYDWMNAWNRSNRGDEAGVLDLSYYDLFDSVLY